MNRVIIVRIVAFFAYLLAQALIFNKAVLFGTAYPYIYPGFLLVLPIDLAAIPGMLLGLALGLGVDAFSNTFGIHAAASVAFMFLRPYVLNMLTPSRGYQEGTALQPANLGLGWFVSYALPLLFVHHLLVLAIEAGGSEVFWSVLLKAFFSTLYSFAVITLLLYLFVKRSKK